MRAFGLDRIWRSRGWLPIEEAVTSEEAIDRLSALFDPQEAEIDQAGKRIAYRKPNPAAQDRLATFSNGTLEIGEMSGGKQLRYDVGSPALLLTFLAPLLFLALGQAIVGLGMWEESKASAERSAGEAEGEEDEDEEPGKLHWIDKMLGAPAPEDPDEEEDEEEENEDYSPENAYGLAALFALLYLLGRFLEPRLFRKTLQRTLAGETA